jgi:hypothetical protein
MPTNEQSAAQEAASLRRWHSAIQAVIDCLHDQADRLGPEALGLAREHVESLEQLAETVRELLGEAEAEEDEQLALTKSCLDYCTEILLSVDPNNREDDELRYAAIELAREAVGDE